MSGTGEGGAPAIIVNEAPADPAPAAQATAEAAVAIAETDAEARVAVAEIHAETDQAAIAAAHDAELIQCRASIEALQMENNQLQQDKLSLETQVTDLTAQLTPPPPPPPPSPPEQSQSGEAQSPAASEPPTEPPKPKRLTRYV